MLACLAAGALARGYGAFGRDGPPALPAVAGGPARLDPVLPRDPTRLLIDVVRPGRRPRLVDPSGPGGLAAGLAAAQLAPGPIPPAGLRSGMRLVVGPFGRVRLACMPALRRLRLGLPLDLNADRAAALVHLPGVGPVLARRIEADRRRRGPFPSVAALSRVPGIGPGRVARLVPLVTAVTAPPCAS